MGLAARDNNFKDTEYYQAMDERRSEFFGGSPSTSYSSRNMLVHQCSRGPHTVNPVTDRSGTKWRPASPYARHVMEIDHSVGHERVDYPYGGFFSEWAGFVGNDWPSFAIWPGKWAFTVVETDDNARAQADTECLLKMGDNKVQLGAALAEARAAAETVASASIGFLKTLLDVKHGRWGAIGKRFGLTGRGSLSGGSNANHYLQLKYGWLPMMHDIHDLYGALTEKIQQPLILSATRRIGTSDDYSFEGKYVVDGRVLRQTRTKLFAKLEDEYLRAASQMGLANPLTIGWEVVPYSFVVDWFVPVGNTLEALTAVNGLEFVDGFRSTMGTRVGTITQLPRSDASSGSPATVKIKGYSYKREPLTSWPSPRFYAKTKSPFTTSNVMSALALLRQLIR